MGCAELKEEIQQKESWNKYTVEYLIENKSKVKVNIRKAYKSIRKLSPTQEDVEDIYGEVLLYAYKAEDFDDMFVGRNNKIVHIEGYINNFIDVCCKRDIKNNNDSGLGKKEYMVNKDKDGVEHDIYEKCDDYTSELEIEDIKDDINSVCKLLECKRYIFGEDIFLISYIKVMTLDNIDKFYSILNVMGISENKLRDILNEETLKVLLSNIPNDLTKAVEVLGKYVYGKDIVDVAIQVAC